MAYYSNSIGRSTTRLTGLSSGLDTDSLIEAAMTASQAKLDRMTQKKTTLEWKRDAYTDVRSKVSTFANKYLSVLSEDNVFSRSAYQAYKVNLSDKYSSYFSVKGTANAQAGSHKISSATMAKKAQLTVQSGRNRVPSVSSTANANSKKSVEGTKALYVKNPDGSFREIQGGDKNVALKEIYYEDSTATGGYARAFKYNTTVSYKVNGYTVSAKVGDSNGANGETLGTLMSIPSGANAEMTIGEGGKLNLESTVVGSKSALTFEGTSYAAGGDGSKQPVNLFGKDGLFGIDSSKVETKPVLKGTTKLSEIKELTGKDVLQDGKLKFTISLEKADGTKIEDTFDFDNGDMTIQDIENKVNNSSKFGGSVKMSFDEKSGQFMIRSTETNATLNLENTEGKFFNDYGEDGLTGISTGRTSGYQSIERSTDTIASAAAKMGATNVGNQIKFKLNDKEFTFNSDTTLSKMMSQINSSDAGVHISYSQITDSFEITSSESGSSSKIRFEDLSGGSAAAFFGVTDSAGNAVNTANAQGEDATIVIDDQTIRRSSNTFTLDGLEITLFQDFQADERGDDGNTIPGLKPSEAGLGVASFSVEQDIESSVTKMKNFVNAYNELVESLYGTITEEKDYDYEPLTDSERSALEKEDIEKYEAEAKKGILHGDSTIRTFLSQMRSAIFEKLGGTKFNDITGETSDTGLSAYDLGFNTSKYATGEYGGKLTFDEDKFREMLKKDPDGVADAMAGVAEGNDGADGFVTKLQGYMADFQSTIRATNLQNTNDSISEMEDSINEQLDRMYEEQERLYQMYAQLETIMTNAQAQMQWMTQQFSSLTTTS